MRNHKHLLHRFNLYLVPFLIGFFLLTGGLEASTPNASSSETLRTAPLMRGTIWWIAHPEHYQWSKEQFAEEIELQREVGFDLLWIFNSPQLLRKAIEAEKQNDPHDILEMIFEIADEKGMRVIVDLPKAGWHGKNSAEEMIDENREFVRRFHRRYGKHKSLWGWYLNHEINPLAPNEKTKSAFWRTAWKGIVKECHQVAPSSVVTISPFFLLDKESYRGFKFLTPEEYASWWKTTLKETGIDILMLQDSGEHLAFLTLREREPFFAAVAAACKEAGAKFWINVETGQVKVDDWPGYLELEKKGDKEPSAGIVPWEFTPIPWLEKKLRLAAKYANNLVNWGYYPFMSPRPVSKEIWPGQLKAYEAYRSYYLRTKQPGPIKQAD
jgi:Domain of unknown function (DUF4434)